MKYNFPGSRVITFWKRPLADVLGFLVDTKFRILEDVTLLDVVALNHQLGRVHAAGLSQVGPCTD